MAIIKITRTQDNEQQFIDDTIAALNPYFDEVAHDESNKLIKCFIGGDLFFTVNLKTESNFRPTETWYINGTTSSINTPYTPSSGFNAWIDRVYVCNNGLMFGVMYAPTSPNNTVLYQPVVGVTRDNHNNTVIITPTTSFDTTNTPNIKPTEDFQAINKNSVVQSGALTFNQSCVYACTTMSTIPVNDNGAYCPHAFKFDAKEPEIMSTNIRKLTLNDVDYLSNGFWCIRDI